MTKASHKPRIAVLRGGMSEEYTLSLQNGKEVGDVLRSNGTEVVDITVTKGGEWLEHGIVREPQHVLDRVDSVYIGLQGIYGEDGTVQRIIERAGVPYQGSQPFQSSIGMHKMLTKEQVAPLGVRLPQHMRLTKTGVADAFMAAQMVAGLFGQQYIVKPMRGGSGIGNQFAQGEHELGRVLKDMFERYDDVLVEERIMGADATCGVVNGFRDQDLYLTPIIEVVYKESGETVFSAEKIAPGRFSEAVKREIADITAKLHQTLDLRHYSRADFKVTPTGEIYFLEVNTLPALTADSPMIAGFSSVGASQEELICHLCGDVIV